MPEPDCFLRYRISAGTRNFTLWKSDVYVLAAAATRGFTMVLFTEPVNRRNAFVGGTCAPPSALQLLVALHCANSWPQTRRALGGTHVPPTKVFRRLVVNKTVLKPRLATATGRQYVGLYVGFSRRSTDYTIWEKAIRFRHPDRAQKLSPRPDIGRDAYRTATRNFITSGKSHVKVLGARRCSDAWF